LFAPVLTLVTSPGQAARMKHDLRCLLCKMQIHCKRGDLAAVRNHLRTEHDMVKYEVELVLHLCLISNKEHDSLIKTLSFRLDKFVDEGTFDNNINLFESKTKEEKVKTEEGMKTMESTLDETAYRSFPETSTPLPKLPQLICFAKEKEVQVLEDKTLSDSTSSEVEIVGIMENEGNSESSTSVGLEVDELTLSVDDDEFEDVEEEVMDNKKKQATLQEIKEINLINSVCETTKDVDVKEDDKESNKDNDSQIRDKGEKSEDIELLILTDEPDGNRGEVEMEETDHNKTEESEGDEKVMTDIKTKQCVVKLAKVSKVKTGNSVVKRRVRTRSVIAKETSEGKAKRRGEKVEEPTRKMVRRK